MGIICSHLLLHCNDSDEIAISLSAAAHRLWHLLSVAVGPWAPASVRKPRSPLNKVGPLTAVSRLGGCCAITHTRRGEKKKKKKESLPAVESITETSCSVYSAPSPQKRPPHVHVGIDPPDRSPPLNQHLGVQGLPLLTSTNLRWVEGGGGKVSLKRGRAFAKRTPISLLFHRWREEEKKKTQWTITAEGEISRTRTSLTPRKPSQGEETARTHPLITAGEMIISFLVIALNVIAHEMICSMAMFHSHATTAVTAV